MVHGNLNNAAVECWFLDVGQGACNVVLLGDGRAIIVDCGPKSSSNVPLKLLARYVNFIDALIISHNDADHDGGAARILQAYPKAIKKIYFLEDRPLNYIKTYALIKREMKAGNLLSAPERLEAKTKPQVLYQDHDTDIKLELIYPTFMENLNCSTPNQTSGVLCLFCGKKSVVFSGDAMFPAWEAIADKYDPQKLPLKCDVMSIPHHGGHISQKRTSESRTEFESRHSKEMQRLYSEIVKPKNGIVSVGSSNRFNSVIHPIPSTITTLRNLGVGIMCTQMTPQCHENLESIRPGLIKPAVPSQSSEITRKTQSGRSKDVACAGSIVVGVSSKNVDVSIWNEHQQKIEELKGTNEFYPLCRKDTQ